MDEIGPILHDLREVAGLYEELVRARTVVSEAAGRDAHLTGLSAEYTADLTDAAAIVADRRRQAHRLEGELRDLEARLQVRRARRARIHDAHSAAALASELEHLQVKRDALEAELIASWEAADAQTASLAETTETVDRQRSQIVERQGDLAQRREHASVAGLEVTQDLQAVLKRLPAPMAARLKRLATQLGNPIAGIVGGACDACGYQLPAQKAVDVDRDREVPTCNGCGRFIVARRGLRRGEWM